MPRKAKGTHVYNSHCKGRMMLSEKRFELLQALRFLGMTGALATQVVVNTTEESIDEALTKAKAQIKEYRDGLQTGSHI